MSFSFEQKKTRKTVDNSLVSEENLNEKMKNLVESFDETLRRKKLIEESRNELEKRIENEVRSIFVNELKFLRFSIDGQRGKTKKKRKIKKKSKKKENFLSNRFFETNKTFPFAVFGKFSI